MIVSDTKEKMYYFSMNPIFAVVLYLRKWQLLKQSLCANRKLISQTTLERLADCVYLRKKCSPRFSYTKASHGSTFFYDLSSASLSQGYLCFWTWKSELFPLKYVKETIFKAHYWQDDHRRRQVCSCETRKPTLTKFR